MMFLVNSTSTVGSATIIPDDAPAFPFGEESMRHLAKSHARLRLMTQWLALHPTDGRIREKHANLGRELGIIGDQQTPDPEAPAMLTARYDTIDDSRLKALVAKSVESALRRAVHISEQRVAHEKKGIMGEFNLWKDRVAGW